MVRMLLVALLGTGVVSGSTLELDLAPDGIQRALDQARGASPRSRAAFHAPYLRRVGSPPVRMISLISEYRRVVLAAEERLRLGDRLFGVRDGAEVVAPWRGTLEVVAELQFHPQHVLLSVPPYDILVWPEPVDARRAPMIPQSTDRVPAWGVRIEPTDPDDWASWWPYPATPGVAGGGQPLTGAWVRARFDARALSRTSGLTVLVKEGVRTVATASFSLDTLR